ncbi:hypothetical protein MVEN_02128300 [Mycena venus]|uniref:Lysine-specific metallo-endopeptidase domain-containing protein n=1 Tax=Mycena venus TaxID=2733690 RepID=A0A8H6XAH1_9AGAR|nr:hypothetical protein MVEN_02128300 [Mycena venus]
MYRLWFTALIAVYTAVALVPSYTRAAVKIHILAGSPPNPPTGTFNDEVCTQAQADTIRAGITDAKNMANVAINVLKPTDMNKSNGFYWLFGGSTVSAAFVSKRFAFVNNLGTPDTITSTAPFQNSATDLIFTCIPASAPKSEEAYANTLNIGKKTTSGVVSNLNLIRFSPSGLANTESFVTAAARIRASGNIASAFPMINAKPSPPLAFTLVHEVQHSNPLLDNPETDHFIDQKDFDNKRAYGFNQIQAKLDANLKRLNPQNYAFFGLLAQSNPEYFLPNCYIGNPLGSAGTSSSAVGHLASGTCTANSTVCAACERIIKGIPSDINLAHFDDDTQ